MQPQIKHLLRMDIRDKIKEAGWTISAVAAKMKGKDGEEGVTQQALSQLLITGNPTLNKLKEIADIIGISVSELLADGPTDFTAFIRCNGEMYYAKSIKQAKNILSKLQDEEDKNTATIEEEEKPTKIAEVIKAHGLTYTEVANRMGMQLASLSRVVHNGTSRKSTLEAMAAAIGCSVDDLRDTDA